MTRPKRGEHMKATWVVYREADKTVVCRGTKAECEAKAQELLDAGTWDGHELVKAVRGAKHSGGAEVGA